MKRGVKTALVWLALLGVVCIAVVVNLEGSKSYPRVAEAYVDKLIETNAIQSYDMDQDGLVVKTRDGTRFLVVSPMPYAVVQRLDRHLVPRATNHSESGLMDVLLLWMPAVILLIVVLLFLRRIGGGQMNNLFELRKSKARPVQDADKARFADIGGNSEAVELLEDIVDFLKSPQRWTDAGARIPRGVLIVGPPGTGKTLLARAVAGETSSAFFYTSAAEFVELFVGVGASRVRDTFEKAAAQQPAVIFIDELDAIGRRRGSATGTMHEEREQTLNQLLISLDGLEHRARLVVMAATNRPDVLDPALLRAGRFDRMLRLEVPTLDARLEILKIHTRNKLLDVDVVLEQIARQTDGFTGADLEGLANEASLRAVRRTREETNSRNGSVTVKLADFVAARESMKKSNRQFDRLDTILVESVSQFAEPTGRAVTRVTLTTGATIEGDVVWMNATHVKLRTSDGSEVVIAKETAVQFVPLSGTESGPKEDFHPDPWVGRGPEVG